MIPALIGAVAVAAILAGALVMTVARASRDARGRERMLVDLIRDERVAHTATLDRVMYAAGKPWEEPPVTNGATTSIRPEQAWESSIREDPQGGTAFDDDELAWTGPVPLFEAVLAAGNGHKDEPF